MERGFSSHSSEYLKLISMCFNLTERLRARIRVILRKNYVTWLYNTSVGIKCFNPIIKNERYSVLGQKEVSPENLFLDIDFLKDKYTLCDTSILDSPHYGLMIALERNEDIRHTDYWQRTIKGTIDSRQKTVPSKKEYNQFYSTYQQKKNEVSSGDYAPIKVYCVNNKYYIADGKHRAALCAMMGKLVKCNIISSDCMLDSYYMWNYRKMKDEKGYSINNRFFEELLNEETNG